MSEHVIIVEDEPDIAELVVLHLQRDGYRTSVYHDGERALEAIRELHPDLVVLDLMLPGLGGYEICRAMRRDDRLEDVPILMLSARGEDADVVTGLELGADDYLKKPFSTAVLVSRVRSLLRRSRPPAAVETLEVGDLVLDLARYQLRIEGRTVDLTQTEFELLRFLAQRPGHVRDRREILQAVGAHEALVRTVDVHVAALRKKLGDRAREPWLIKTVRGVGYLVPRSPERP